MFIFDQTTTNHISTIAVRICYTRLKLEQYSRWGKI